MPNEAPVNWIIDVPPLPPRDPAAHKGDAGRVLLIAGSRGMSGAAILCGLGALRGGAGLVRLCVPRSIQPIVASFEPSFMTVPLEEDSDGIIACDASVLQREVGAANAVAIGPGLGRGPGVDAVCRLALERTSGPLVIDADAINSLAVQPTDIWQSRRGKPTVITPHPGEMKRLLAGLGLVDESRGAWNPTVRDDRMRVASQVATRIGAITVLKGRGTVVCEPSAGATRPRAFENTTGNPGMATGGMGDVLTGTIVALLGQRMSAFDAACLAVHAHGLAADKVVQRVGPVGYLAREVADGLPMALSEAARGKVGFR